MKVTDITLRYGEKLVLDHVSLTVIPRQMTALAGPSGCGKTTLLRVMASLVVPQGGTWELPDREDIAILFQENRLFPELSVRRQVECVLPRGVDPMPYLQAVGLEQEAESAVDTLSGGMQRRLALARCLAYGRDKAYLLLDEPFAGVDPERARAIMEFIRSMGKTVVLSAHEPDTLSQADRVVYLE